MKISIGSDHHGVSLRNALARHLREEGNEVTEFGPDKSGAEPVDYPDVAGPVARRVSRGDSDRGILICATGIGMSIAANKYVGVRAAVIHNERTAELSRRHNDLNVLCLPGELIDEATIRRIVNLWMKTPFDGGRHECRVKKIETIVTM